jgi:hypothetical protein
MEPLPPARRLNDVSRPLPDVVAAAVMDCSALLMGGCTTHSFTVSTAQDTAGAPPTLVAPPAAPSTSTCGQYGMYAETTIAYTYLLSCSSGTLFPTPTVTVAVGSIVKIAGFLAAQAQLALPAHQTVARLEGNTITGLMAGQVVVTTQGIECATTTAGEPAPCPLMTIKVR